mgnify:CR=1 FL=1
MPPSLTAQSDIEELIPVSEFFGPWTGVIDAAEPNTGGRLGDQRPLGKKFGIIAPATVNGLNGFGDRHTDAGRGLHRMTLVPGFLKWIRRKRHRCQVTHRRYERAYLKSPNTVRYLSHISRVNEP